MRPMCRNMTCLSLITYILSKSRASYWEGKPANIWRPPTGNCTPGLFCMIISLTLIPCAARCSSISQMSISSGGLHLREYFWWLTTPNSTTGPVGKATAPFGDSMVTYWAWIMWLAVVTSWTAIIMSPLNVRSILLICQFCSKLLISLSRSSATVLRSSSSSPQPLRYADAYIVIRLSGVKFSSATAFSNTSLLESLYKCTIALRSVISKPSHGLVRFVAAVSGIWIPYAPPLILPRISRMSPLLIWSFSANLGFKGFHAWFT